MNHELVETVNCGIEENADQTLAAGAVFRFCRHGRWLFALSLVFAAFNGWAATPLISYNYNETGITSANSGSVGGTSTLYNASSVAMDLHSASGTGVSGLPDDRALDLTSAGGMGSAGGGPQPDQNAGFISAINGLTSFTITGWFKTDGSSTLSNAVRLLNFSSASTGFSLWSANVTNTLALQVNGVNSGSSNGGGLFGTAGSWVFFAVSYDGTASSSNVNFYAATPLVDPTLKSTFTLNQGSVGANAETITLNIGNTAIGGNRGFDGYLDNIAIYGSLTDGSGAISLADIQTIYTANLTNTIPEPSVISCLAIVALGIALSRQHRAKRAGGALG